MSREAAASAERSVALSVVVPVFNGAQTVGRLVEELATLDVDGGLEIVLVDDGSSDASRDVCRELVRTASVPVTFVGLARNYGEHHAVLAGLREARGAHVVTMDDDLQNPPREALRLHQHARTASLDAVYSRYDRKRHAWWRNAGSRLANWTADQLLDKPRGLYLSSFRCLSRFVVDQIARYDGPYPYIDGLVFQTTSRVGAIDVEHLPRAANRSNYSLGRLFRLWLTMVTTSSPAPLRLSVALGVLASLAGLVGIAMVLGEYLLYGVPVRGWTSLMLTGLVFSGAQLVILGLLGEYLGRVYVTVSRRPQSIVRELVRHTPDPVTSAPAPGAAVPPTRDEP